VTAEAIPPSSADQAALSVRSRRLRRVAVATAVPAGAIGVLGIIGWVSGAATVVFVPRAVTIVPFVAVAVLLLALSLGLLVMVPPRRLTTQAVRVVAAALLLVALLTLLHYATGFPVAVEGRLLRLAQRVVLGLGDAPLTPPLAAICVALLSVALLLLVGGKGRRYAGLVASVATIEGAMVCLGYAYAAPLLLYNYPRLVALPGGIAFLLLGTATVAAAGPHDLPLRMLVGSSARAMLLRRFLPVTIGALLVTDWVTTRLLTGLNPALASAASTLMVTCCVAVVVLSLARITGAKLDRALIATRESEKHFRDIFEHATIGMYRTTPDGRILLANPALLRMLGYGTLEALAARNLERTGFEPGQDRKEFREEIESVGEVVGLESVWTRTDGTSVSVRESARVVRDGNGDVLYYEGTVEDITERKQAEQALKASETRFRSLIEHSMDLLVIIGADGRLRYASPSATLLLGYDPGELMGHDVFSYVHPDHVLGARAALGRALQGDTASIRETFRFRHRDGSWRALESVVTNLLDEPTVAGVVLNARDVTDRSRAEEELRASEERLQSLFAGIDDALFVHDTEGWIIDCNDAACRHFGYTREELFAMRTSEVDAPEFASRFRERLEEQLRSGRFSWEGVHVTKDGRRVAVDIHSTVIDYHGTKAVLAVMRDITERKGSEEALRRSEADFRGLVEHAPLGIYRSTRSGQFLTVNPALIKMLGYAWAEDVLRLDMAHDVYAEPAERDRLIRETPYQTEVQWKRRDGSHITVRLTSHGLPSRAGEEESYEGLVEDVTEQRSLENQYRQAQRMEAVGRLAGGVAHDFNNILTAITGYSDLLLEDLGPDDPKRSDVEEIQAAALRAAALTRQLLAFSRKQVLQTRVLDLNVVVQTLEKMLHRLIGEDVKLEFSLASALGAVRADPGQIEQIVLNLAVNSRDAMPNGGSLTIETADVDLDEAYVREHMGASPGRYVMLAVSDTGIGMDAETRSHVFEPFFTTKELGKGTGLGLATVYGIVKQSGGSVWVYSEPGRGTTIKIYLPHVDELPEELKLSAPAQPVAGGRETVLLAEDDPSVRAVVSEVLAQKGYNVLSAPDGQVALKMASGQPGQIRLLVTDIVMPGMTGRELAEALMAERPGLRVLYMSGYTDDAVIRHGVLAEGMPYLQKPFTPRALASKVREILDRP